MQKYQNNVTTRSGDAVRDVLVTVSVSGGGLATIYSDNSGTPKANPFPTDANGHFDFYAADDLYNISVNGVEAYTDVLIADTIAGINGAVKISVLAASGGAAMVGYADPLSPSIAKTVADLANGVEVSILRFIPLAKWAGIAAGSDSSDLTANIQAAFDAVAAAGRGSLVVPGGVYNFGQVNMPSKLSLRGAGRASIFRPYGVMAGTVFLVGSAITDTEVRDVQIDVNKAVNPNVVCVYLLNSSRMLVENVYSPRAGSIGVMTDGCTDTIVRNCVAQNAVQLGFYSVNATRGVIDGCYASNVDVSHGFQFKSSTDSTIRNCISSKVKGFGANLYACVRSEIRGLHSLDSYLEGANLLNCQECAMSGINIGWTGDVSWPSNDFGISMWGDAGDPLGGGFSRYNRIQNVVVSGASQSAVALADAVTYTTIEGITAINPNSKNEAAGSGVLFYGSACQNNVVDGVTVRSANGLLRYGAAELDLGTGTPSANAFRNINTSGQTLSALNLSATTTAKSTTAKAPANNIAPINIESFSAAAGRAQITFNHLANPASFLTLYKDETGAAVVSNDGNNILTFATNAASRMYIDGGGVIVGLGPIFTTSISGIGYAAGAGGTVTQATSKSTAVSLSKACGQVVMNAASLAANTSVSFTLNNGTLAASDTLIAHRKSGGTAGAYRVEVDSVAAGSAVIKVTNLTAGALAEAITIGFSTLKAAIS